MLVEADKDVTTLMNATMKKAQGRAATDLKGSSVWRKYKQVKVFLVNQMMPCWEFRNGNNERDEFFEPG